MVYTYKKEMDDTTKMSSVSGSKPECNNQSLRSERLWARRQQESHEQCENTLQLRRSRRLQARKQREQWTAELRLQTRCEREHQESSEQRELRLQPGMGERQRQRWLQEQRLDRLRTRNRSASVIQDLLMHAMMITSFLSMWRIIIFPGRTVSQI